MKLKLFFLLFLLLLSGVPFFSIELSNGYKDFILGSSKNEVEQMLEKSFEFDFTKKEVLTMRLEPDREILTADGYGFVQIGYFHFYKDRLYQIFLNLSDKKVGYYSLLSRLTDKYGTPSSLDDTSASWTDDKVNIIIEKPCKIKYIDVEVWNEILRLGEDVDKPVQEQLRNDFIDQL